MLVCVPAVSPTSILSVYRLCASLLALCCAVCLFAVKEGLRNYDSRGLGQDPFLSIAICTAERSVVVCIWDKELLLYSMLSVRATLVVKVKYE